MPDEQIEKLVAAILTIGCFAGKSGGADAAQAVDRYHEIHRLLNAAEQRARPADPATKDTFGGTQT